MQGIAVHIAGTVQGVGFRPWVWRTAKTLELTGSVSNRFDGVHIELFGATDAFLDALHKNPPPLSKIDSVNVIPLESEAPADFRIIESDSSGEALLSVSPDMALCEACREELFDPANRRFRYPFINCVDCGPRFSIIEQLPYDRPLTTMKAFDLCTDCRREYTDPADRRYHAQPVACPACGPKMDPPDWEMQWQQAMEQGRIMAVKGIGGFHLACHALNPAAVRTLRERKGREAKPFALMVPDLEWVHSVCCLSDEEERLLTSRERPIVLLEVRTPFEGLEAIAPGLHTLGVMLPYTPMHELMVDRFPFPVVMTSANYTDEPMIHENGIARERLEGIADGFMLHDRPIANRCDDAVCAVLGGQTTVLRPGRGCAPVSMPFKTDGCILAFGADMKNTFALAHHGRLTLHPYIGDLAHPEAQQILMKSVERELDVLRLKPDLIVHDAHPDYFSTRLALDYAKRQDVPAFTVQHHHAHLLGTHPGPAIGFAFDGTGYGTDGTIWGGEVIRYDRLSMERSFYLRPFALPGGEAAVRQPARILDALRFQIDPAGMSDSAIRLQLESGINCPVTSSMGRLFDAVSCLLGICERPSYDGEAAMRLEAASDQHEAGGLPFELDGAQIDWRPLFKALTELKQQGEDTGRLAARFHNTVAAMVLQCGRQLTQRDGPLPLVFAGGVFQNRRLVERIRALADGEFDLVFSTYPNDSGIAVGQAAAGAWQWESK